MSPPRKKDGCIKWDGMIAFGENPGGQTSQTADETVRHQQGLPPQERHWNQTADGPRWNDGFQQKSVFDEPAPAAAGRTYPTHGKKRR